MRVTRGVRAVVAVALVSLLISRIGSAEDLSTRQEADRLFEEGRNLLRQGAVREACSRFAQSYELLPRAGTELNLAVCREQEGDRAAAARHFRRALAAAIRDGRRDRQELAQKHLEALKPRLAWLSIERDVDATPAEVEILADGEIVARDDEQPIPIEPGAHTITARSTGHETFQTQVTTVAGASYTVAIPTLTPVATAVAAAPTFQRAEPANEEAPANERVLPARGKPNGAPEMRDGRHAWGTALVSAGAVMAVVGGVFGVRAIQAGDDLASVCPKLSCRTGENLSRGRQLAANGEAAAWVANIALPIGVVIGATGAYFLATGKRSRVGAARVPARPLAFSPVLELRAPEGGGTGGVRMRTTW